MSRFIDISLDLNLSLLDKNYDPETDTSPNKIPSEHLIAVWAEINLEYTELMDNGNMKSMLTSTAELELLKLKFNIIAMLVEVLKEQHIPELVEMLIEFGFNFSFDPKDSVKYQKDLGRVLSQAKALVVQIRVKEAEIRGLAPKDEQEGTTTRDDWEDSLIALSDDAGYALDTAKLTVYQYATRYKNLMRKFQSKIQNTKIPNV